MYVCTTVSNISLVESPHSEISVFEQVKFHAAFFWFLVVIPV